MDNEEDEDGSSDDLIEESSTDAQVVGRVRSENMSSGSGSGNVTSTSVESIDGITVNKVSGSGSEESSSDLGNDVKESFSSLDLLKSKESDGDGRVDVASRSLSSDSNTKGDCKTNSDVHVDQQVSASFGEDLLGNNSVDEKNQDECSGELSEESSGKFLLGSNFRMKSIQNRSWSHV